MFDRMQEKDAIIQDLHSAVAELNEKLSGLLSTTNYNGVNAARRWLAEHIGYDLRQVAKCPCCTGINTTPANPEKIGARFICKDCGTVFFIVKTLHTDPASIRNAYHDARQEEEFEVEVLPRREDPYRDAGRNPNWVKRLLGAKKQKEQL